MTKREGGFFFDVHRGRALNAGLASRLHAAYFAEIINPRRVNGSIHLMLQLSVGLLVYGSSIDVYRYMYTYIYIYIYICIHIYIYIYVYIYIYI